MSRPQRSGWLEGLGRVATGWPRLFISLGIGIVVLVALLLLGARTITATLLGWDVGVIAFMLALVKLMMSATAVEIERNAARQDVGQVVVLALAALAALASVVAIYAEVSVGPRRLGWWQMPLGITSVVLSWFFVHAMFAVHYAHEFYRPSNGEPGGLEFPHEPEPDYWDFFYFSIVIGMTAQVADVAVSSRRMRHAVTAHGIVAFWFNVAVLALLVNIGAAAIGG